MEHIAALASMIKQSTKMALKDAITKFFQNIRSHSASDTASHAGRPECSQIPSEPQIAKVSLFQPWEQLNE
jgi:hypothetical protein